MSQSDPPTMSGKPDRYACVSPDDRTEMKLDPIGAWIYYDQYCKDVDSLEAKLREVEGERDDAVKCRETYQREANKIIRGYEAIIAKLPTTADGVPVVPGMEVWGQRDKTWEIEAAKVTTIWGSHGYDVMFSPSYSHNINTHPRSDEVRLLRRLRRPRSRGGSGRGRGGKRWVAIPDTPATNAT